LEVPYGQQSRANRQFNVVEFLKQEFFQADDFMFARIAELYKQLYGQSAYKYLLSAYAGWKSGAVKLSEQTMRRILECVPKFLSAEKRFYILRNEVVQFNHQLHEGLRGGRIPLPQINDHYCQWSKQIEAFQEANLTWFLGKGIFSADELRHFTDLSKYVLLQKLQQSHQQLIADLSSARSCLKNLKTRPVSGQYEIAFLGSQLDVSGILEQELPTPLRLARSNILSGSLTQHALAYLQSEAVELHGADNAGRVNGFISSEDLEHLVRRCNEAIESGHSLAVDSNFCGEGGILSLSLSCKSSSDFRTAIAICSAKLIAAAVAVVIAIAFLIQRFTPVALVCILLLGATILFPIIRHQWSELRLLLKERRVHG